MFEYLLYVLYVYLAIGLIYGARTFKETAEWLDSKYPAMTAIGYTKLKKFGYTFFKINALGFAFLIHLVVMSGLWSLDLFTKKRG